MEKNYHYSSRPMALASYEIANNLDEFAPDFEKRNSTINQAYRTSYHSDIDSCLGFLGIDLGLPHKVASSNLNSAVDVINSETKLLRSDLNFSYRYDTAHRDQINNALKLDKLCTSKKRDVIFDALTYFMNSIAIYQDEMIKLGVNQIHITDITTLGNQFITDYKNQDKNISKSVTVSDEQQLLLNKIYTETLSICDYGQIIFKNNRSKSGLFAFSVIAKKYMIERRKKKDAPSPIPPPATSQATPPANETSTQTTTDNPTEPTHPAQ